MLFPQLDDENFFCQHLFEEAENLAEIQKFSVQPKTGEGLELYLKELAAKDENGSLARTYLVKDKNTREIAAYFTLKNGLFTIKITDTQFHTIPGVELANFAVNAEYRKKHPEIEKIGRTTFYSFVLPLVDCVRSISGAKALYIYALDEERLMNYYASMGFYVLPPEDEKFVHTHVKPKYDAECIFMYQIL